MSEKYGFVYIWYDRKHKRFYIGSHWGYEDDGYICSSKWMKNSYKRRKHDFKRRILSRVYTSKKELLEKENEWLQLIKKQELKIKYYNLRNSSFINSWYADEIKNKTISEKISLKIKERFNDPEFRKKYDESLKNRNNNSNDPVVREKRKQSMIKTMENKYPKENRRKRLKADSDEYKLLLSKKSKELWENRSDIELKEIGFKISKSLKGKQNRLGCSNTEEQNRKIRESNLGQKRSEEAKENMRQAQLGKKQSEETKKKRSEAIKLWWENKKASL